MRTIAVLCSAAGLAVPPAFCLAMSRRSGTGDGLADGEIYVIDSDGATPSTSRTRPHRPATSSQTGVLRQRR